MRGIVLAFLERMPQLRPSAADGEPTVMWRMQKAGDLRAHAVVGLRGRRAWVMWFLNDYPLGVREFEDWASAIRWSDRLQAQNWTLGWRLSPDS